MKTKLFILSACIGMGTTAYAEEENDSTAKTDDLNEVVVTASHSASQRLNEVQIGIEKIDISKMGQVPAIFGEKDIIKSLQMLPGVKSDGEGSCGFQVRGGTSAQNLVLVDNAPMYNTGHLVGLFSAFNDEALQTAALYKGQIPAKFGGATSSVLDIATKPGNMYDWHGGVSIGLLASKVFIEGPIADDNASFLLTARRSYMDFFLKADPKYKDNTLNFYDINYRADVNASPKSKMFVSFYHGKDNMAVDDLMEMHWGNTTLSGGWKFTANDKLRLNTTLAYSYYGSNMGYFVANKNYVFDGHIKQGIAREAIDWRPNDRHSVSLGAEAAYQDVLSAEWDCMALHEKNQRSQWDINAWVNDDWKVSNVLEVSAGLRYDHFGIYDNLEPRASMKVNLSKQHCIKAGYSRTTQNIHAIRSSNTSMPMDRYTISTSFVKPEQADQVSLGYIGMTKDEDYDFSVEGYYKWVRNIYDYKDGKMFSSEIEIENLILGGKGRAYGVELCAHKNNGNLTGWASYTLSWSENKIDGINNGNWYTANNDRRHDINLVGMYKIDKRWNASAAFVFTSGQALTAPSAKYKIDGTTFFYYNERNGYRAPSCHHLDLSATYTKHTKKCEQQWTFGIYNIYNRENPYVITFTEDKGNATGTKATQTALFGAIPFIAFSVKY